MESELSKKDDELRQLFLMQQQVSHNNNSSSNNNNNSSSNGEISGPSRNDGYLNGHSADPSQLEVSIASTFYDQLLCKYIYADLTGARHGEYSVKIGHNF